MEIPNLVTSLRPCFMMSPLSVSVFLEAQSYNFDMVVFDEASQIRPEEAINSIYRASQVIIAGDSKQLPPTNFFSKKEDDIDEDEDDGCICLGEGVEYEEGNQESLLNALEQLMKNIEKAERLSRQNNDNN